MIVPKLSVSLPCWQRPERTRRMIECIGNQNINGWEALITGDHCPVFQKILESSWYQDWINDVEKRGNKVITGNLDKHYGGYGYQVTNSNINNATGEYFIFLANDDRILPTHFAHYLSHIEHTDLDFVYFNSWLEPRKLIRWTNLRHGGIGHSELIIRTDFLKQLPMHNSLYGHDWSMIEEMLKRTKKYCKSQSSVATYQVMHIPPNESADTID